MSASAKSRKVCLQRTSVRKSPHPLTPDWIVAVARPAGAERGYNVAVVSYVSNDPDVAFVAIAAACYSLREIFGRVQQQKEKRR
jgi:hypothetical protein